ncbi:uncharacterized protein TNCV_3418891 [Trichonephila clavipes]|nr:uncharacterized protein TNCV_3418891 [Trichonephila clavipes]
MNPICFDKFLQPKEVGNISTLNIRFKNVINLCKTFAFSNYGNCSSLVVRVTSSARKLIAPQLSQTYAQVAKSSTATSTTQTDENITQIKCPPLQLLQPLLSVPQPNKYPSITSVSTSSSTTQANLLPSESSIEPTTEIESRLPEPISSLLLPLTIA